MQKRHLLYSLIETHALFLNEHPDIKGGLSKFTSLCPMNVLFSSDLPRNVCLCEVACADKGAGIKLVKWEIFEMGKIEAIAKESEPSDLLTQEITLTLCNPVRSDHRYLMAVLPQRKLVIALESLVVEILKPTAKA